MSDEQLDRPLPIGQGSVRKTIVHLYAAEFVWLEAISGNPDPVSPFEIRFNSMANLESAWQELDRRWDSFYKTLSETDLDHRVEKKSTSSGAGSVFATSLADVLLHIYTHAQYTSAQLKNMLRQLGKTDLPDVMLITMSRQIHV